MGVGTPALLAGRSAAVSRLVVVGLMLVLVAPCLAYRTAGHLPVWSWAGWQAAGSALGSVLPPVRRQARGQVFVALVLVGLDPGRLSCERGPLPGVPCMPATLGSCSNQFCVSV